MGGKRASRETVEKIRGLRKAGKTIKEIVEAVGLSRTAVRNWLQEDNSPTRKILSDTEIVVLQNLAALLRWPTKDAIRVLSRVVPFGRRNRPDDRTYRRVLGGVLPKALYETRKPENWCLGTFAMRVLPITIDNRDGTPAGEFTLLLLAERRTGWVRVRPLPKVRVSDLRALAKNSRKKFAAVTRSKDAGYVILMDEAATPLHLPESFLNREVFFRRYIAHLENNYNLGRRWPKAETCPASRLAMVSKHISKKAIRDKIICKVSRNDRGTIRLLDGKASPSTGSSPTSPGEQAPK